MEKRELRILERAHLVCEVAKTKTSSVIPRLHESTLCNCACMFQYILHRNVELEASYCLVIETCVVMNLPRCVGRGEIHVDNGWDKAYVIEV